MTSLLSLFVEMGDEKAATACAKGMMRGYWTLTKDERDAIADALDRPFMDPDSPDANHGATMMPMR